MSLVIREAADDAEIARCHPVLVELRPVYDTPAKLVGAVRRQFGSSYHLAYRAEKDGAGRVVACAGWRVFEHLAWGRALYVDDLVTLASERSKQHGDAMIDWLLAKGRALNCASLQLDSGTFRHDAHRFYFRQRMNIASYHFSRPL
jgi:hypothetical protein